MKKVIGVTTCLAISIALSLQHADAITIRWKPKIKTPQIVIGPVRVEVPSAHRIVGNIGGVIVTAGEDIQKGVDNVLREADTGISNVGRESEKAARNAWAEGIRISNGLVEAGVAIGNYVQGYIDGSITSIQDAEQRLREGKILDSLYHLATDPILMQERLAADAVATSEYLNTLAIAAAGAYGGGPYGTAAYAAWRTFNQTENVDLAIQAGLIAGMSSSAFAGLGNLPSAASEDVIKKAVLAGSVGGLAVAASGGDENDIVEGFLWAGGMVLVQDGYREFTGHELDGRGAANDPYCISATDSSCADIRAAYWTDENGKKHFDPSKLDQSRSFVGVGYPDRPVGGTSLASDNSALMRNVAKIPGMNAMALFHDTWVVSWDMSSLTNKLTIPPAVVLTYIGVGAPLYDHIIDTATESSVPNTSSSPSSSTPSSETISGGSLNQSPKIFAETSLASATKNSAKAGMVIPKSGPTPQHTQPKSAPAPNSVQLIELLSKWPVPGLEFNRASWALSPAAGWLWENPGEKSSFDVRLHPGLSIVNGIVPADGWRWVNENDPLSFEVIPLFAFQNDEGLWIPLYSLGWTSLDPLDLNVEHPGMRATSEGDIYPALGWGWRTEGAEDYEIAPYGLELTEEGAWQPKTGWDWLFPNDPLNLELRPPLGLKYTEEGWVPAPRWEWVNPEQSHNLDVKLKKEYM